MSSCDVLLTWGSIFRSVSAFTPFPWVGTGRYRPHGPVPGGTLRRRAPSCPGDRPPALGHVEQHDAGRDQDGGRDPCPAERLAEDERPDDRAEDDAGLAERGDRGQRA